MRAPASASTGHPHTRGRDLLLRLRRASSRDAALVAQRADLEPIRVVEAVASGEESQLRNASDGANRSGRGRRGTCNETRSRAGAGHGRRAPDGRRGCSGVRQSAAQAGAPEDAVLDWNLYAVQALINAPTATPPGVGQPPPVSVLHLGMVQGAVYDAVNTIDGGHEPYLDGLPSAPASASKAAAVATAAHDVLVGMVIVPALTPAIVTRLDGHLADSLAAATDEDGLVGGGRGDRRRSGGRGRHARGAGERRTLYAVSFTVGSGVGDWRPTPPDINDPNAWVASSIRS